MEHRRQSYISRAVSRSRQRKSKRKSRIGQTRIAVVPRYHSSNALFFHPGKTSVALQLHSLALNGRFLLLESKELDAKTLLSHGNMISNGDHVNLCPNRQFVTSRLQVSSSTFKQRQTNRTNRTNRTTRSPSCAAGCYKHCQRSALVRQYWMGYSSMQPFEPLSRN